MYRGLKSNGTKTYVKEFVIALVILLKFHFPKFYIDIWLHNEEALQRRLGAASSNPLQGALARAAASKRNEKSHTHHF